MWACIITPAAHVLWKCWRFSSFYSLLLFQRADNRIKFISLRSAGQKKNKPDAFIIRSIKAGLCIVSHVPQFSAGPTQCTRRDYLATCTTQPWDFSKNASGLLRHRNQWKRSGKSEQHRGSRLETSGVRHTTNHNALPTPPEKTRKSPFRFMARAHLVWNATRQHTLFSLRDQYHLGGAAVFLQALHVGDCNSFLFISLICNALDWTWSRCSITPSVKTLTFIMGLLGNFMLSSCRKSLCSGLCICVLKYKNTKLSLVLLAL